MERTPHYHAAQRMAEESVAPPVPLEGIPYEDRNAAGRELPRDEPLTGVDAGKWALMNRRQRRDAKRGRHA